MKKRMLCCLLALVLAVGLLSACGSGKAAVYVQSVAALTGYGSLGGANASSGVVVAQKEIKVDRDSSRKVKQLNVEVGQEVKTGEVLFTYDMEDMQLTIDKAKLEIEQMKNNVKDLTAQISQLEKEKKSAPTSEQLSYTVQIQALEADKKEAEYNITVKQKELDSMTSGSGSANVTAPVDGKVQSINENGTDSSGNAAAYITLVQDGAYRVKGKINELNRSDIAVGVPVVIRSRVDDSVWSGTIMEIDTENPSSGNAGFSYGYGYSNSDDTSSSSNYPFYVELDSTDGLMLGQHVYIEPSDGGTVSDTMKLDASFLQGTAEEGFWVWAEKDGASWKSAPSPSARLTSPTIPMRSSTALRRRIISPSPRTAWRRATRRRTPCRRRIRAQSRATASMTAASINGGVDNGGVDESAGSEDG
ncbi:MAG: efflux RND transporter periplasmic adaptor subunit [Oscillospiraceae bacterium]